MRLRCHIFGCLDAALEPRCVRCGAGVFDETFVSRPALPLRLLCDRPYCATCGKHIWPWQELYQGGWCSEVCFEEWMP